MSEEREALATWFRANTPVTWIRAKELADMLEAAGWRRSPPPDPRVAEIRARLEAATPGPWAVAPQTAMRAEEANPMFARVVNPAGEAELGTWTIAERVQWPGNQQFIANAPADIAYLLSLLGGDR